MAWHKGDTAAKRPDSGMSQPGRELASLRILSAKPISSTKPAQRCQCARLLAAYTIIPPGSTNVLIAYLPRSPWPDVQGTMHSAARPVRLYANLRLLDGRRALRQPVVP